MRTLERLKEDVLGKKELSVEALYWEGQDTRKRIITDENKVLYGVMGRNYFPVWHGNIYDQVKEWLPDSQIVNIATGGRNHSKAIITLSLPDTFDVKGQQIKTYVNLVNSLDGSYPIGLIVSPLRVACTNQFTLLNKQAFIRLNEKHTQVGVARFNRDIKIIDKVYEVLKGQLHYAEKLAELEITTDKGVDFLNKLKDEKLLPEKVLVSAQDLWENPIRTEDEGRNYWSLFNSITEPLNQNLREKHKVNTFKQIEKVGDVFSELQLV